MDLISDTLTRIKNAVLAGRKTVTVKDSKMIVSILEIFKKEGFIANFKSEEEGLSVELKFDGKEPAISGVKRMSSPGCRVYMNNFEIHPVMHGRGLGIISTSQGVMSTDDARAKGIGGEYICYIW
jgi:small subunit ribosomal protein S8